MKPKYWRAYRSQKSSAAIRGIKFLLSFEQWLAIWEKSERLSERGRRGDQYCMARFKDKGPYKIGNVKIITHSENLSEGNAGRQFSERHKAKIVASRNWYRHTAATKRKMAAAKRGIKLSVEHRAKLSKAMERVVTPAYREKMRLALSGKRNPRWGVKLTAETKAKISAAQIARLAAKRQEQHP